MGTGPSVSKDGVTTFEVTVLHNQFVCTGNSVHAMYVCLCLCM